jgi:hypothetical protein
MVVVVLQTIPRPGKVEFTTFFYVLMYVFNLLNAHRKLYLHITQEMLPSKEILRELTEHYG